MDMKGSIWFLNHKNDLDFDPMGIGFLGQIGIGGAKNIIPEHFNYTKFNKLGESLIDDSYMLTNKRWELSNRKSILEKARLSIVGGWGFDIKDMKRFEKDITSNKIYSNGGFNIFLIYGQRNM